MPSRLNRDSKNRMNGGFSKVAVKHNTLERVWQFVSTPTNRCLSMLTIIGFCTACC